MEMKQLSQINIDNNEDNNEKLDQLLKHIKTQADFTGFFTLISSNETEFRNILNSANLLNKGHVDVKKEKKFNMHASKVFAEQLAGDFSVIQGVIDFSKHYGADKLKDRHWDVAKQIFQKYSFSGDLYQAIEKADMSDSHRLKMVMAINSLLKNIDIYFNEIHFYEFYETCRAKFEPDTIETENNSAGEVDTAK
jgi:hypothetical protein